MKYFVSLAIVLLSLVSLSAQDKTVDDLIVEADQAVEAKNFAGALSLYEKAMAKGGLGESEGKVYFNAAHCARKSKKYDKAVKYYSKSEKLNYKPDMSSYYIAYSYKELGQGDKEEQTLVNAITKYSKSKYINHMKKMLVTYYLAEGSVPFNEGNNILGSETPMTDEALVELYDKANVKFKEAKVWFEKAKKYAPTDEKVLTTLKEIETNLSKGSSN